MGRRVLVHCRAGLGRAGTIAARACAERHLSQRTMNRYSDGTLHFGMVVSSSGFTSGCESWATSHNLGLLPPLKGKNLAFAPDTVLRMFERSLVGLQKRVRLKWHDLAEAPAFFDFIYSLIADFEGHEEIAQDGRYYVFPERWVSSFGEMYSFLAGRQVEDLVVLADGGSILKFAGDVSCRFTSSNVEFGSGISPGGSALAAPVCSKNFAGESCTLDFIKRVVTTYTFGRLAVVTETELFGDDGSALGVGGCDEGVGIF
jgi:hypothetical protein